MENLLKEALKLVCGVNKNWSYAVFWKFGCQNPKLLIWEECYHGSLQNQGSALPKIEVYNEVQAGDPVHILIDKMMMSKQVNMVGEGLVGRAAFTGNYQWIVSGNYNENDHPAEVLNEVHLQLSAGMQTIVVIPVIPHGVLQLASPLAIMENVGFVHDVKSVILQVGCVRSTFMSENYGARNSPSLDGLPVDVTSIPLEFLENQMQMNSTLCASNSFNLPKNTSQIPRHVNHLSDSLLTQFQNNLHVSDSIFSMPNLMQESCKPLGHHNTENIGCISAPHSNSNKEYHAIMEGCNTDLMSRSSNFGAGVNGDVLQKSTHSNMGLHRADASINCGNLGFPNHDSNSVGDGIRAQHNHDKGLDSDSIPGDFCGSKVSSAKDMVAEDAIFQSYPGDHMFGVGVSNANSKKPDETGKTNRKRLKHGKNPRPRPEDRQMIQDRVNELREIVPNGAKFSIDALLERTIKHMLFLQSVTKHADKLKQTMESKTDKEDGRHSKDNFEAGATWAFELGSQSTVCPIVVEDLNLPRQLLIEMLCEERGFFLEIADIIRGLSLTILKGVMEAHNDKIWARFAVEANRDVTRMEVFISLVHLLEQTLNGSSGSTNDTTDKTVKVHPTPMGTNEQLVGRPIVCGEPSAL